MKRILMAVLFAVAMMASITCYAQITVADLNIGGIYLGMSEAEVIEKLGQPIRRIKQAPAGGTAPVFKCGNAELVICCNSTAPVESVDLLSGDGVYTAAGIGVGSSYEDVIKTYGQASHDTILTNPTAPLHTVQYRIKNLQPDTDGYLEFHFNSDKKVSNFSFYLFYR